MKLTLRSIVEPGNLKKERLTLRAETQLELGDYIVAQNFSPDGSPTTNLLNAYWFPYVQVNSGDLVVVYSKGGENRTKDLSTGKVAHFFYLGLEHSIWDDANMSAVVLHAPKYEAEMVDEL